MAKFKKISNEDLEIMDASTRYFASNRLSESEVAEMQLRELDERRNQILREKEAYNKKQIRTANKEYDYSSSMKSNVAEGYGGFSRITSEDDYRELNPRLASSMGISRTSSAEDHDSEVRDLRYAGDYPEYHPGIFGPGEEELKNIMVESALKEKEAWIANEARKLGASNQEFKKEREQRQSTEMDETFSGSLSGMTSSDLRSNKLRTIAHETPAASDFGLVDEEQAKRRDERKAKVLADKKIEKEIISRIEKKDDVYLREMNNLETSRAKTIQDSLSESNMITNLGSLLRGG